MLNTFIGKAHLLVATSYGLMGRKEDVRVQVAWLLKKSQFTYGGLDADVCSSLFCYNVAKLEWVGDHSLQSEYVERDFGSKGMDVFRMIAKEMSTELEEGPGGFEDTQGNTG